MITQWNWTWAVAGNLWHEVREEGDVDFAKNGDFFSFVFFLSLAPPKAVSSDEGDVVVAPFTPRRRQEIRARKTECLGKFDFHEFFDDVMAAEKAGMQP